MAIQASAAVNDMLFVLIGERLLQANEDLASASHVPYRRLARNLDELAGLIEQSVVSTARSLPSRVGQDYVRAMGVFVDGGEGGYLRQFARQLDDIADGRVKTSYQILEAKWQVIAEVIRLLIELAVVFAMAVFSGGAAAGRAVVARGRSRVAILTILATLERIHVLPVVSEAFEEAFQTFAVRLGMIAFTSGEFSPTGFDWKQIAQDGVFGAFAGLFHRPLAGVAQGAVDAVKKGFGRGAPVKDLAGDVVAKAGAGAERGGVNRLPGGGDGVGGQLPVRGGAGHPGMVASALAEGGSESLAELLGNGLFYGQWATSWTTFSGAVLSGASEHKLRQGAVASGAWINKKWSLGAPPVVAGPMRAGVDTGGAGGVQGHGGLDALDSSGGGDLARGDSSGDVSGSVPLLRTATVSTSDTGGLEAGLQQSGAFADQDAGTTFAASGVDQADVRGVAVVGDAASGAAAATAENASSEASGADSVSGEPGVAAAMPRSAVSTTSSVSDTRTVQARAVAEGGEDTVEGVATGVEGAGDVGAVRVQAAGTLPGPNAAPHAGMAASGPAVAAGSAVVSQPVRTVSGAWAAGRQEHGETEQVTAVGPAESVRTVDGTTPVTAGSVDSAPAVADTAGQSAAGQFVAIPAETVAGRSSASLGRVPVEAQSGPAAAPRSGAAALGPDTAASDPASRPARTVSGGPVREVPGPAQPSAEPVQMVNPAAAGRPTTVGDTATGNDTATDTPTEPTLTPVQTAADPDDTTAPAPAPRTTVAEAAAQIPDTVPAPDRVSTVSGSGTPAGSGSADAADARAAQEQDQARPPAHPATVSSPDDMDVDVAPAVDYAMVSGEDFDLFPYPESREGEQVWRFSGLPPEHVFREGFRPEDPANVVPVMDWVTEDPRAQFVATTRNRELWYGDRRYRYQIDTTRNADPTGIDINATLGMNLDEQEIAFTGPIAGPAVVSVYDRELHRTGTWNPATESVDWTTGELLASGEVNTDRWIPFGTRPTPRETSTSGTDEQTPEATPETPSGTQAGTPEAFTFTRNPAYEETELPDGTRIAVTPPWL
ncbi:scabin-related ADP-ribosyltransferase, partial [Streptomyces sp. NPDC002540]